MAKFTKLNIGDTVASGGGRVLKKLSAESAVVEDELAGTWLFNDTLAWEDFGSHNVNFTSNSKTFTSISYGTDPDYMDSAALVYANDSETVYAYNFEYTNEWSNEAYKTITITSTLAEVTNGDELLTWLKANATKQTSDNSLYFTLIGNSGQNYGSFPFEEGMTFTQFVNSSYNPDVNYAPSFKLFYIGNPESAQPTVFYNNYGSGLSVGAYGTELISDTIYYVNDFGGGN
jgi:hypothetical protein